MYGDPARHTLRRRTRHAVQGMRMRAGRIPDDHVVLAFVRKKQGHRITGDDMADERPEQRADVGELSRTAERARQTRDREKPIVEWRQSVFIRVHVVPHTLLGS